MKIALTKHKDPYMNLATEEVILKDENIKEDVLLLYINENAIILGRNQNVHEEINSDFVKENNISLFRRISGGGTVYHDNGNINFSFITNKSKRSYEKFLNPIINFLKSLNLNANFKGKNDLVIDGYKVSGNAQYIYKDRMFHHGTLLFDTDLTILGKALKVNKLKLKSKSIKSVHQRVSNIRALLKKDLTPNDFVDKIINYFTEHDTDIMNLTNYKNNEIKALSNVRKSNNWIYVKNPEFNIKNERRFNGGTISVLINVKENKIKEMQFFGDFLSNNDFENIINIFVDQKFNDKNIENLVNKIKDFNSYFGKLTKENVVDLILGK